MYDLRAKGGVSPINIHQSSLKSYARCGEQHRRQLNGEQGGQLSATAFGSVIHHALHTLERSRDLNAAINTFEYYWNPANIDEVCAPVDIWIARQSYSSLLLKGRETLKRYWDLKMYDDEEVLALELPFAVQIRGTKDEQTGEPHVLLGTIDRLSIRSYNRQVHLNVDDWKSGKKALYLKNNVQFSAYCYATLWPEFWVGNPEFLTEGFGEERGHQLMLRLLDAPRHGWWINVMGGPDWSDAGLRVERDYQRFVHSVSTYVRAVQNDIFPLNIDGMNCQFCPFRDTCPEGL